MQIYGEHEVKPKYDKNGKFGACHLSDSSYCYSFNGNKCNKDTQVVDLCPLDYGGSGDGCGCCCC